MNSITEDRANQRRSNHAAEKLHRHVEQCPVCKQQGFGNCKVGLEIFLHLGETEQDAERN